MTAAIEADAIRKVRRTSIRHKAVVLDDVSFTVESGEIVGLLGPNGAGKSTTLRIIAGLARPTSGHVLLGGSPPSRQSMQTVGSLIEAPAIYPWMNAAQNLSVLTAATSAQRNETLASVGLDENRKPARQYSQGMRQRLAIAVAILNGTQSIVLDEPANGLDPAGTREFETLLTDLRDRGRAVLVSSHQLTGINRICDRVVLLSAGRVIAAGTTETLRANRPWQRVRASNGDRSKVLDAVSGIHHSETDLESDDVVVDTSDRARLVALLAQQGISAEVETVEMSLEDRFLSLTQAGRQR